MHLRTLVSTLFLLLPLVACPPVEDDLPPDDDDSAAADDDDTTEPDGTTAACSGAGAPYNFEFSGEFGGNYTFDDMACTDYNGDNWNVTLSNSSGWILRFVAGPLVEGELLESGIDITLQNNGKQAVFSGRTATGHVAAIDVQIYEEHSEPCGALTTEDLASANSDGSLGLSPQPILFDCR